MANESNREDLEYSTYLRERIQKARKEVDEGKLIDQDEVEERMRRWLDE